MFITYKEQVYRFNSDFKAPSTCHLPLCLHNESHGPRNGLHLVVADLCGDVVLPNLSMLPKHRKWFKN